MTPYYADPMVTLLQGDVREVLRGLPADSVQTVVTSPPYWSLRDYGIPPSVWGGEDGCEHEWQHEESPARHSDDGITGSTLQGGKATQAIAQRSPSCSATCLRCGAWRGALGLEPTPDLFVAHMVEVFREVRRVLRPDGTLWCNLGDSYSGNAGGPQGATGERSTRTFTGEMPGARTGVGLKPKDLVGIPWMVAFALRADGWYLRQDIIWAKPNPMPESVRDRCTKAHEYLFLLGKSGRYYYDADAVREASLNPADEDEYAELLKATPEAWYQRSTNPFGEAKSAPGKRGGISPPGGRNKRSVWSIPTAPFPEAHFATFPPDLVRPCVLAGTSEAGCCAECGAPWERVTERTAMVIDRSERTHERGRTRSSGTMVEPPMSTTTGWRRTCDHDAPSVPCTVLDPFAGSGTTAMVAKQLGRKAVGIDLNAEYLAMAVGRLTAVTLPLSLFAQEPCENVAAEGTADTGALKC